MAVWLRARNMPCKLRDGRAPGDPVRTVGGTPVRFDKLDAGQFEGDTDVEVVQPPRGRPKGAR